MKKVHIIGATILVLGMLLPGGCHTVGTSQQGPTVTFLTENSGEFTFQRDKVIAFLQTQKVKSRKAAALLTLLSGRPGDASVALSCDEYCPVLFNGLLAAGGDFLVRCKDCHGVAPLDTIRGRFADASQKEIQYIDKSDHVLINIRLQK